MKQYYIGISIALLVLNIIFIIATLAVTNWSEVNGSEQMSLTGCVDCEKLNENWNFECFARSYCEQNDEFGACKVNTNLYKASYAFLVLEVISLIMALLLLEKKVIWLFKKQFAQGFMAYVLAGLMLFFHLLGLLLWFAFSDAKWSNCSSTSDAYQTPDVCAKAGPSLALTNVFLMSITLTYFIIMFRKRSALNIQSSITLRKIFWIKGKFWALFILGLLLITYILILASLTTKKWVSDNNQIEGSLFRCKDCSKVEDMSWQCLSGTECEIDSSSSTCKLYKRLYTSSRAFVALEAVSIIFLLLFAQNLSALIKEFNYGIGCLNYTYPILAMLFNLLGCIIWFSVSEAQFSGSDLSALDGPSLSVASQFFLIPLSALFCLVYRLRTINYADNRTLNMTIVEKVQNISIVNDTLSESPKKPNIPQLDNN